MLYAAPRWYAGARVGDVQSTPGGVDWRVVGVSTGGREIAFEAADGRKAKASAAPDHPEYPTDAAVAAAEAAVRRALRAMTKRANRMRGLWQP